MEQFKQVEKAMKTKAFSKEGLAAAAMLTPEEKEKEEACQCLQDNVNELQSQVETLEAEVEALQATVKRGKKDTAKASKVAELEASAANHKKHIGKLETMLRLLENGSLETGQVMDLQDPIRDYIARNMEPGYLEDDEMYDDLNLSDQEETFGMNNDNDRVSSQDNHSVQEDVSEDRNVHSAGGKSKTNSFSESAARRPSAQMKSPLPTVATLHPPLPSASINNAANSNMKPAPLPTRPAGETLKYASAAAAAAASDKSGVGIAPLPPPPSQNPALAPFPAVGGPKSSNTSSPSAAFSQPVSQTRKSSMSITDAAVGSQGQSKSPAPSLSSAQQASATQTPALEKAEIVRPPIGSSEDSKTKALSTSSVLEEESTNESRKPPTSQATMHTGKVQNYMAPLANISNGQLNGKPSRQETAEESVYHLPPGLQDLIQSFEATKARVSETPPPTAHRLIQISMATCPDSLDAEKPRHYKPQTHFDTPIHYPQEPLPIFDDPRLYSKIDMDTLFYVFYYCQGTYHQYLAAQELKKQSWRFHKQYQTWFQRHEEPKTITDEYEQGTYRFFDYESTWQVSPNFKSYLLNHLTELQDESTESRF
jgi:CCR4-NOT transcription complex subunit 3